jgi:hypothetical protein
VDGWWQGVSTPAPAAAISAQASISPGAVHFGDPLAARAVVILDPARIEASSVRLVPQFLSYRVVQGTRDVQREGGLTRISYTFRLECLTVGCAPGRAQVALDFPAAALSYRSRAGTGHRLAVAWPGITVASRLDDADRADPGGRLRADTSPPPVSYRLSPDALVGGLAAAAALLVLAAGTFLFFALRRTATAAAEPDTDVAVRTPLEDALRLVRETAANGNKPELRRLALQRLVRELHGSSRGELARSAGRLAWSNGAPSAADTEDFVAEVEKELSE